MSRESVTIRVMTSDDVSRVTEIHTRAFPIFFLTQMGRYALKQVYMTLCKDAQGVALVAVDRSSTIVGFAAGTVDGSGVLERVPNSRKVRFLLGAIAKNWRRPSVIKQIADRRESTSGNVDGSLLYSIAVDPSNRELHVGRSLFDSFVDESKERGAESLFLTTDAHENHGTLAFYSKMGMQVAEQFNSYDGRAMLMLKLDYAADQD